MSVNSYLTKVAGGAIIRESEKESIQRSIATIQSRLNAYFSNELSRHFLFGSYTRGTILPRSMDSHSDIDYIVVFNDSAYKPQAYLDKLRRFVNYYYSSSEISQSHPTIVLSLNHIKFELVPATRSFFGGVQIPAKSSDYNDWISTDPNDFNQTLTAANQTNHNMIKPVVRLVKYWNAKNNYPFESYELETMLAERSYVLVGGFLGKGQLKDYFFDALEALQTDFFAPQYKKDAVNRAHQLIQSAKLYLSLGQEDTAQQKVQRLIPPVGLLSGLGVV